MVPPSALPLQIRVSIRDVFDAKKSPAHAALARLNSTTGFSLDILIAWVDVYNDLKDFFPDKTTMVPTVCQCIGTFLDRIDQLLDASESFQEQFLEKMKKASKTVSIQIHDEKVPKTELIRDEFLTLFLPKNSLWGLDSQIGSDLANVFGEIVEPPANPVRAAADDFIEITHSTGLASHPNRVKSLPSVASLARPEILFQGLLPYTLMVTRTGSGIDVECSHQKTLELIVAYFEKYARKDMNDSLQRPYLSVSLIPSFWGTGTNYDVARITRTNDRQQWVAAELSMILTFVENICGYTFVSKEKGEYYFRRSEPFA